MDVENGVCAHDESEEVLLRANLVDIALVQSGVSPFSSACARCEIIDNYDMYGSCVCTPFCGSCAPELFNLTETAGVACVTLNETDVGFAQIEVELIAGAGAVRQGSPNGICPQRGFRYPPTVRLQERGGHYAASIADLPPNSLQIIDMNTSSIQCSITLLGTPSRIVYVHPPIPPPITSLEMLLVFLTFVMGVVCCCLGLLFVAEEPSSNQSTLNYFSGHQDHENHSSQQQRHDDIDTMSMTDTASTTTADTKSIV